MRVIVTRPEREAALWVRQLGQHGLQALALPLIAIGPCPDPAALRDAWRRLPDFAALMFVSGNAVEHFFGPAIAPVPHGWCAGAPRTRAWSPGPGTRDALLAAGVDAGLIDAPASDAAQFDSESLWQQVAGQVKPGQQVLIVRGGNGEEPVNAQGAGREWLARRLEAAGVKVETVAAYVRRTPVFDAVQIEQARRAASDGAVWLFSSSEAIARLAGLLPGQSWTGARAVATHPRIAQAAREAGFGVVCESRPALEAVIASIESIR